MKKIDIHCHTTNRKIKGVVPKSEDIDAILFEMKTHDIEKTVLLATYFPHKSSGISNYRMYHWIARRPEFIMFGSLDFEHYFNQGMNELEEMAEQRLIAGVKIYTCYQEIDLESKNFRSVVSLAKRHALPVMFHTGYSYSSLRKYGTPAVTKLVGPRDLVGVARQDVPIIMSHMGKPFINDLIEVVGVFPNVYADLSGLLDSRYEAHTLRNCVDMVKKFLDACGPERVMFGTDFPVQTHEHSIHIVEEAMKGFSDAEKEMVYCRNARRILKL